MEIDDRRQWVGFPYGDDPRRYQQFGFTDPYERLGFGYRSDPFGFGYPYERFGLGYRNAQLGYGDDRGEHTWRGGILGWLGAGIRAGAGWFGSQLQQWGSWFGGRVSGGSAEIGRAVRGRGERVASVLEDQDERTAAMRSRRNRSPRYRRPDERILDDVWHRICVADVDPEDVEVGVSNGVVTLSGRVSTRFEKRLMEDIADSVFGVQEVHNHVRLAPSADEARRAETLGGNAAGRGFDQNAGQAERH